MAFTSAWAVGSWAAVTVFAASATIWPSRATSAANGPPAPVVTFCVASRIARRKNSGLAPSGIGASVSQRKLIAAQAHRSASLPVHDFHNSSRILHIGHTLGNLKT
jgi:hypothetical protein